METMKKNNGKRTQANEPGALGKMVDAVGDLAKATKSPLVLHGPLRDPKLAFTGVKVFSATKMRERGEVMAASLIARKEIERLRQLFVGGTSATEKLLVQLLDEIELTRPAVIAALGCTGEDGKDGIVDLAVAAEELAERLENDVLGNLDDYK